MPHASNETLRKSLHIALGFGAFLLRWIPWEIAAGVCVAAVFGNWLLLHRIVGKAVSRHERGYDVGIVLYPFMVLLLVLVFRNEIAIAGAVWAILAFGDGFATVAGRSIRGPRLPWNPDKSWSGFVAFGLFGATGALAVWRFLGGSGTSLIVLTVIVCAIVESLPLVVDDNLTVPIVGGFVLWLLAEIDPFGITFNLDRTSQVWLGVNVLLSIAAYLARSVDFSGLIGGFLLGAIIIIFGGWHLYAALLAFFILGTATTKLGYRRKAAQGLAQEKGGRRGFRHAFANVGVAAILSLAGTLTGHREICFLAAVASLATAAADTCASEIGQLIGRRTFLPLTFRVVPRGTEGAVSLEGTLAGAIGGAIVAAASAPKAILLITSAAFLGSYIESIVGSWNRKQETPIPNDVLNFFNTAVGAGVAALLVFMT